MTGVQTCALPISQPPSEPIAEQIARSVSPKSAAWIRANSDVIDSEKAVKRMVRAHDDAVDDGIEPETEEYFAFIEQRLGIRRDSGDEEAPEAPPPPRRSSPPPAAPVSRGGQRPNVVRLTKAEAEAAKMFGMSEVEYAKNKVALQREGKIGR